MTACRQLRLIATITGILSAGAGRIKARALASRPDKPPESGGAEGGWRKAEGGRRSSRSAGPRREAALKPSPLTAAGGRTEEQGHGRRRAMRGHVTENEEKLNGEQTEIVKIGNFTMISGTG